MEETTTRRRQREGTSECGCEPIEEVAVSNLQKKPRTPAKYEVGEEEENMSSTVVVDDQEQEDMMAWLTLQDDDTVTELFELLDSSGPATSSSHGQPVKFIDDPYSSLVIFQASSAYVTINGNEESCGSSFSDLDSSVMASVDMGSVRGVVRKLSGNFNVDGGGAEEDEEEGARGWLEERDFMEGIFVKSLRGSDLFGTPPPSGFNYENEADGGGGGGDDEMWINFVGEDLFGGSW